MHKDCFLRRVRPIPSPPTITPAVHGGCLSHGSGHLERVKLPHFSGKVEEYMDFKMQFKELCGGKRYPAVIELTQLQQKLPKEAVVSLVGLTRPDEAWIRLDEIYENREQAILSAIRHLRGFKSGKSQPCDQIIDIARAFQKCRTVLEGLDAFHELYADRETTAAIVDGLPAAAQERWFQRRPRSEETQVERSICLVGWLEQERQAAVTVHLNNLAKTSKIASGQAPHIKSGPKLDSGSSSFVSTDMGLASGALLTLQRIRVVVNSPHGTKKTRCENSQRSSKHGRGS